MVSFDNTMKLKLREVRSQPVVEKGQQGILLSDPLNLSQKVMFIPGSLALLLVLMDGTRDIGTLKAGFDLRTGITLSNSVLDHLVSQLDEALFLENERFNQAYKAAVDDYRSAASRSPVLMGKSLPENSTELKANLEHYFDQLKNADLESPSVVKGLISPHIDFERGGHIYAEVWSKAKAAVRQAELIVILGTDHNEGSGRITLTYQNYETPWGVIPTAQEVVDEFEREIGQCIFDCEINHRGEHSIEAAIIWLHYLLGDKPCYVLPILCGSFQSFIERGESPLKADHVASAVEILKRVTSQRRTIVVAAADLAHMGPAFGDPYPLDLIGRAGMERQDTELITIMCRGDAEGFYTEIQNERDCRHVCGVPPIYITLSVLSGASGKPTGYAQCPASEDGTSLVSICGILYGT